MRTAAVWTLATASVILTGSAANADPAPTPTGGAWSTAELTPAAPWTSVTVTERSTTTPAAGDPGTAEARKAPNRVPARRPAARRTGSRTRTHHWVAAPGCRALHGGVWIVRPGDTTWRISACTHHTVQDLVKANKLPYGGRLIFPGDRITIPTR